MNLAAETTSLKKYLVLSLTLFALFASPGSVQSTDTTAWIAPAEDWCGTQRIYEQELVERFGTKADPAACGENHPCDDPVVRDDWIPGPEEPVMYVRMIVHVLALDDGSNVFSTPEHVAGQVAQLNLDFAPVGIQFIHEYHQVNSTAWRNLSESEIDDMKSATAIEPDKYLNVWVTVVEFSYSFATFPWSYDALSSTGGIVMGHFHWVDLPNRVFAHEVGHTLGLYHTFHGVDEVNECGACYEVPETPSSLVGDLCADTPPTPTNSGPCTDFSGSDPCSGLDWGYTMPENYMGYATQVCLNTFTPQQRGRLRCWTDHVLDGWVIPFFAEPDQVLGPAPLEVQFTSSTHKQVAGWNWDFGDGDGSTEANPVHTYDEPGLNSVEVTLTTPSDVYNRAYPDLIGAYADTIDMEDGFFNGTTGLLNIEVTNKLPLQSITIPFTWDGPMDVDFDVAFTSGLRSSHMEVDLQSIVPTWKAATIRLIDDEGLPLDPGTGPVVTLRFFLNNANATGTAPIAIEDYAIYHLNFKSPVGDYVPVSYDGSLETSCCRGKVGDANGDNNPEPTIGDITAIIDHMFISQNPLDCYLEADINQSGGADAASADITIGDLTMLIDHMFINGIPIPDCI